MMTVGPCRHGRAFIILQTPRTVFLLLLMSAESQIEYSRTSGFMERGRRLQEVVEGGRWKVKEATVIKARSTIEALPRRRGPTSDCDFGNQYSTDGGQAGRKTIDEGSVALMIYFRSVAPGCALSRTNVDESYSASTGTCRYLNQLAFNKSVWLGLLSTLRRRGILDRTSANLENLSTEDMIKVLRQLITGPETWSPGEHGRGSIGRISRKITLHPKVIRGVLQRENVTKLLPSGRYVLFNNWEKLECWNVANDRLVWTHTSAVERRASVVEFAAEETETEDSLIVMICLRTKEYDPKNYVEIVRVDLQAQTHDHLLVARAPESEYSNCFCRPVIRGTLAAVCTDAGYKTHMLLNWKEHLYFVLNAQEDATMRIALIEEHIILMTPSFEDFQDQIHVISNATLRAHWAQTTATGVSVEDIHKLSTFEDDDLAQCFHDMAHYTATRYLCLCMESLDGASGFIRSIPRRIIPCVTLFPTRGIPFLATQYFCSTASGEYARVEMEFAGTYIDVAPYSGALTYSTSSSIVIQYYK
ncbi:hypothetical protein K438DRAFT_1936065 [Mycena galopus ATCC 62051]|nr:hypothetical protein K438DRAFT_1936065 [Mycena galopus ATCC 62051]